MASASHRDKRVNKEVTKIFEKFPAVVPVATSGQDVPTPTGR
jgi:hypothetical protein